MTQDRKKVKKNHPKQTARPHEQYAKEPSAPGSELKTVTQISDETAFLLNQLINNMQELHVWQGTILEKLNKVIDKIG